MGNRGSLADKASSSPGPFCWVVVVIHSSSSRLSGVMHQMRLRTRMGRWKKEQLKSRINRYIHLGSKCVRSQVPDIDLIHPEAQSVLAPDLSRCAHCCRFVVVGSSLALSGCSLTVFFLLLFCLTRKRERDGATCDWLALCWLYFWRPFEHVPFWCARSKK